ncbi:guanine deaminase [Entomospira nematocerorum]|uniref:Guanine deaminase n=1 Tax=Entomospira nematocerorum TaxID=2719987 RepID=A0A968GHK1_9SPIO|nr:guanine deaminase [Entomospira nematocera]NIZ47271.1 guanine deaminase [Entomospira nematocera]WDI34187.1 guanine deaminase [Entomospira nematocera]
MSVVYDFILRGRVFTFINNPFTVGDQASYTYYEDGALVIKQDKIIEIGSYNDLNLQSAKTIHIDKHYLIMPSFIDSHVHYPQVEILGSNANNLLDWLNKSAYKAEEKYHDLAYARQQSKQFLLNLIDNGITAAGVFCSSHPNSVQALFEEADESNLHITAGQVWMDRNAPQSLIRSAKDAYKETEDLIKHWHGHGNLRYALTPRFPITSTPEQLEMASDLIKKYPDITVQSHIAENKEELIEIAKLFPQFSNYASLYDHYGLLNQRSVYAHGNFLTADEVEIFADRRATLAHCPSSNEFLGNPSLNIFGLHCQRPDIALTLGSDLGAGTSLNPWDTMAAAYRASRQHGHAISAIKALYLHTLGGAKALNIDDRIGKFESGYQADIAIINTQATGILEQRMQSVESLEEEFFVLMTLGSTQTIERLYVSGVKLK